MALTLIGRVRMLVAAAGLAMCASLAACGGSGKSGGSDSVAAADFVGGGRTASSAASSGVEKASGSTTASGQPTRPAAKVSEQPAEPTPVVAIGGGASGAAANQTTISSTTAATTSPAAVPITTTVDSPPRVDVQAGAVGPSVIIESLVGQINGRPVFASDVLEPLDGRLRQAGAKARSGGQWAEEAATIIGQALRRQIEDELVLAEARRNLTPEQKQGLLRFLEQVQQIMVSSQQGSSVAADEALRESTGRSLQEEAKDRLDRELILKELRDKVAARIVVSWTDIRNEYERTSTKWNPPSTATFRMITADPKKPEAVEQIKAMLGEGKTFSDIAASDLNTFNRAESGKMERKLEVVQAEGEFIPIANVNTVLRGLAVGQVVGPINYSTRPADKDKPATSAPDPTTLRNSWVYLERIDHPEGVSLYDAQLEIENSLRGQRTNEAVMRYMDQLRRRGNVSRIDVMAQRLMYIATERYASRFMRQ